MINTFSVDGAQQVSSFFSVVAVPMAKFSAYSSMGSGFAKPACQAGSGIGMESKPWFAWMEIGAIGPDFAGSAAASSQVALSLAKCVPVETVGSRRSETVVTYCSFVPARSAS